MDITEAQNPSMKKKKAWFDSVKLFLYLSQGYLNVLSKFYLCWC
jgi:hypothetical protein